MNQSNEPKPETNADDLDFYRGWTILPLAPEPTPYYSFTQMSVLESSDTCLSHAQRKTLAI